MEKVSPLRYKVEGARGPACFGVKAQLERLHMANSLFAWFSPLCQDQAHLPELFFFLTRLLHFIHEIQISIADAVAFCYLSILLSMFLSRETETAPQTIIAACV